MHFRRSSVQKHQEDKTASIGLARDQEAHDSSHSTSLGSTGPTQVSLPMPDTYLPGSSLDGLASGIDWNIPHLEEHAGASSHSELDARSKELNQQQQQQQQVGPGEREKSDADKQMEQSTSNAIDIILARARTYAPETREIRREEPWWVTRSDASLLAAEKANKKLEDRLPPDGTELYFIYPHDGYNADHTRTIDKHLEDTVDAYAMDVSTLFDVVLFWRAFLTESQLKDVESIPQVLRVERQPRFDPTAKGPPTDFTVSRENNPIDEKTPPSGTELYQIWPHPSCDGPALQAFDAQLEAMAGVGNLYMEPGEGRVQYWRAFLTPSQFEQVQQAQEVDRAEHWATTK